MPRCRVRRCLEAISAEVLFALVPAPGAPPIRPVLLEELARKADRDRCDTSTRAPGLPHTAVAAWAGASLSTAAIRLKARPNHRRQA